MARKRELRDLRESSLLLLYVFMTDVLPLFLCKVSVPGEVCGRENTHSFVPCIPELRNTDVEADAERERASEDGRHEDTCGTRRSTVLRHTNHSPLRTLTVALDKSVKASRIAIGKENLRGRRRASASVY